MRIRVRILVVGDFEKDSLKSSESQYYRGRGRIQQVSTTTTKNQDPDFQTGPIPPNLPKDIEDTNCVRVLSARQSLSLLERWPSG